MTSLPRLTVDREADAAYVLVRDQPVARTETDQAGFVSVDYDGEGGVVGYELLTLNPTPETVRNAREARHQRLKAALLDDLHAMTTGEGER